MKASPRPIPCAVPFVNGGSAGMSCPGGGGDCSDDRPGGGCAFCDPGTFSPLPGWFMTGSSCMTYLAGPKGGLVPCPAEPPITT